jgi:hypothetical protein
MLHGAIADIVKLAPGQGYGPGGASKLRYVAHDLSTIYRAAAGFSPQLFYLFETGLKRWMRRPQSVSATLTLPLESTAMCSRERMKLSI